MDVGRYGVELVAWPTQRGLRDRLARAGVPRLLLVGGGDVPDDIGLDEDWVELPIGSDELEHRCARLALLVHGTRHLPIELDEYGVVRRGPVSRSLGRTEAAVMRCLLDHLGDAVTREQLAVAGWGTDDVSDDALLGVVYRLRRRTPGLAVRIVGSLRRGFSLVHAA